MMNIVLYEPEIPYNTGNIARTCVITGTALHLIEPLGFLIDDKHIKKAGLDYWHKVDLHIWKSFDEFIENNKNIKIYMATTKTNRKYTDIIFDDNSYIMFGPESRGIPENILKKYSDNLITIPMRKDDDARSLNLSNSAAIILYEALRQTGFKI